VRTDTRPAIDLFKKGLDALDERPFLAWLAAHDPLDAEGRSELAAFVDAERARLVKLRSLGLTRGTDERVALVERIRAALARG
jgi:hypothetical protein